MNVILGVVQLRPLETLKFGEEGLSANAECNIGFRNFIMVKIFLIRKAVDVSFPLKMKKKRKTLVEENPCSTVKELKRELGESIGSIFFENLNKTGKSKNAI